MKRLLLLILIVFLFSCEKKESYPCYKCETLYFNRYTGGLIDTESEIVCDKSEIDIALYQAEGFNVEGSYVTTRECKEQ